MTYEIYVGNDCVASVLSIEDLMCYIIDAGLSIIDEDEDLENFVTMINCEVK